MLITAFYTSFSSALIYKFLYSNYNLSPSETNACKYFATLSFLLRPFYGFLTDKVPIYGSRRKVYLYIYLVSLTIIWIILASVGILNIPLGLFIA